MIETRGTIRDARRGRRGVEPLHAAIAALLIAFLFTTAAHAYSAEASQQFQIGRRAFEAQDYAGALEAFEAAVAAGMAGPAVHFNIGVCAYRLGRLERADAAFRETARTPEMSALAHYNLGLVALRGGKPDEAARWFSLVEQESSDERLRALASAQLAGRPRPAERNWLGYASLAAGYDDNVALISGDDVLGVSGTEDGFAELQLAAAAPLAGPWRFDAGLVLLDYQEFDSFDQMSANGGARYRAQLDNWNGELALQLAYATLDGEGFESKRMLVLQASRALPGDWRLRTRYRFSDIDGLNDFSGLDGRRHELDIRAAWRRGAWDLAVRYRFDASDYADEALSLNRHQLAIDLQRTLNESWTVEVGLARNHSHYDIGSNSEDRTELELAVSRALSARWRLVVRYAYADNQAELPEFDYRRNRISAGVEAIL